METLRSIERGAERKCDLAAIRLRATFIGTQLRCVVLFFVPLFGISSYAQNDAGEYPLDTVIERAINAHPSVLAARAQYRAQQEDQVTAERQRFPTISVTSELNSEALTGRSNSSSGADWLSTNNTVVVAVQQPIWTWGRLTEQIEASRSSASAQSAQIEESRNAVAINVVNVWQGLASAQEKIVALKRLRETMVRYLEIMQRRVEAKVSAPIELELIGARMAQISVDMASQEAAKGLAISRMTQLLGGPYSPVEGVGALSIEEQVSMALERFTAGSIDSLLETVANNPSARKAALQAEVLKHQLRAAQAAALPEFYIRTQYPLSSGGTYIDKSIYVGLRYTPGAGFSSWSQAKAAAHRAQAQDEAFESVSRDLKDALYADLADFELAKQRLAGLRTAIKTSTDIVNSYERQFISGKRVWLDVVNAVRENGDYTVAFADARATLLGAVYRLRIRSGRLNWQKGI